MLAMLLFSVCSHANTLEQIEQQIEKPEKLSVQFVQDKHIAALSRPLTSKGQMWLIKNSGVAWLTKTPINSQVFITENGINGIDTQGTLKNKAFEQIGGLLNTLFNADLAKLKEQFEIEIISHKDTNWHIALVPKSSIVQSFMQRIELTGNTHIESVLLLESQTQKTHISFSGFDTEAEIPKMVIEGLQ